MHLVSKAVILDRNHPLMDRDHPTPEAERYAAPPRIQGAKERVIQLEPGSNCLDRRFNNRFHPLRNVLKYCADRMRTFLSNAK